MKKSRSEKNKGKARKKKGGFFNDEEKKLIEAYERGEFRPVGNQKRAKQVAVKAARRKVLEELAAYDQELEI
jgi:hypothetical protein